MCGVRIQIVLVTIGLALGAATSAVEGRWFGAAGYAMMTGGAVVLLLKLSERPGRIGRPKPERKRETTVDSV